MLNIQAIIRSTHSLGDKERIRKFYLLLRQKTTNSKILPKKLKINRKTN